MSGRARSTAAKTKRKRKPASASDDRDGSRATKKAKNTAAVASNPGGDAATQPNYSSTDRDDLDVVGNTTRQRKSNRSGKRPSSRSKPSKETAVPAPEESDLNDESPDFQDALVNAMKRVHVESAQENNDDICHICFDGGSLICCSHCVHAYHKMCVPPLQRNENFVCAMAGQRCTPRTLPRASQKDWVFLEYPDEQIGDRVYKLTSVVKTRAKNSAIGRKDYRRATATLVSGDRDSRRSRSKAKSKTNHVLDVSLGDSVRLRRADIKRSLSGFATVGDDTDTGKEQIAFADNHPPLGRIHRLFTEKDTVAEGTSKKAKKKKTKKAAGDDVEMVSCLLYIYPEQTLHNRHHLPEDSDHPEVLLTTSLVDIPLAHVVEKVHVVLPGEEDELTDDSYRCCFHYELAYGQVRPIVNRPETAWTDDFTLEDLQQHQEMAVSEIAEAKQKKNLKKSGKKSKQKKKVLSVSEKLAHSAAQLQLCAAPALLPCRESERETITNFIEDALQYGNSGTGMYISGVPGTGKTATVRRVVFSLMQKRLERKQPAFEYLEINAMKLLTPSHAYSAIWAKIHGQSVSPATALTRLQTYFHRREKNRPFLVLLLDEFDYMVGSERGKQQVVYNLFDFQSWPNSRIIVIGIANTLDLPERLMPRVHSRLGLTRLPFKPYSYEQIEMIISARLQDVSDVFHEDALQLCGRKVAGVSGDIRRALQICSKAVEICRSRDADKVTIADVNNAVKSFASSPAMQFIENGSLDEQLYICALVQELHQSGLHEADYDTVERRYRGICRTKGREHASRTQLRELVDVLFDTRLIELTRRSREPRPFVGLNVMPTDVKHALRDNMSTSGLLPESI